MKYYIVQYREKGNKDAAIREQIITAHTTQSAKEIFNGVINKGKNFTIIKLKVQ